MFLDNEGNAECASATRSPLPDDLASAFITDPPYYDAVPYADLSDFFYVWLKRTIGDKHPGLFSDTLSPKGDECIVDEVKGKDRNYFEETMARAMSEGRRILSPSGVGMVVFAHKTTSGWEAMLQAMVDAGWMMTGSWPIDTEMGSRLRAQNSAALASSIHLVCRPRENPDGTLRINDIGDWRDVLQELPGRIHDWMPRLAQDGIVGADAIFACLGPALEIYSRYSRVEKASGEQVTLGEYLEHVWAAVSREALNMIFEGADTTGFEPDARLTAIWLWTLTTESDTNADANVDTSGTPGSSEGFTLEYDTARKIAQGLGARMEQLSSVVEIKGAKATLLPVSERARYLFGSDGEQAPARRGRRSEQLTFFEEEQVGNRDGRRGTFDSVPDVGTTTLDRVHQSMLLFSSGRGEALRSFLVDEGVGSDQQFWRLAQALSALYPPNTEEKRWVDGVMARKTGLGL